MPKTRRKPAYTHHKGTNQARVRINGKDHYLGEYGSPESRERYDDLIAEWFTTCGDTARYTLTIDDLCLQFMEHAEAYYRHKDDTPTGETTNLRHALSFLVRVHGRTSTARIVDSQHLHFRSQSGMF
jgi:hypothetical protein